MVATGDGELGFDSGEGSSRGNSSSNSVY